MESKIKHFLSNNHTFANAFARVAGLVTAPLRQENVVMFHCGRCGSSIVGMLLNQHTEIKWAGEIFENIGYKYGRDSWVWENPLGMAYMRTKFNYSSIFGFELKKRHFKDVNINIKETVRYLSSIGYEKFIILKRKNYLDKVISRIVGKKIGTWNTKKNIDAPVVRVPTEDVRGESLLDLFRNIDEFYLNLEKYLPNEATLNITYEDDIKKSPINAYIKIIKFLGIKKEKVKVDTVKLNKRPTREKISNYDEVKRALDGTRYEWMLE